VSRHWLVWLTGPPAAGKSEIARALRDRLAAEGTASAWLESDALRPLLAPSGGYSPESRERFYAALADLAALLSGQGLNVNVDATASRRAYRARLRERVPEMLEVFVDAPLSVREARDPKGLYRRARAGDAPNLPGATEAYEPPLQPDLRLSGTDPPEENARRIAALLRPVRGLLAG
jgi:adenylylsulfate kinase